MKKLYTVRSEVDTVVVAESEEEAEKFIKHEFGVILCDYSSRDFEHFVSEFCEEWDGNCLPYGVIDDTVKRDWDIDAWVRYIKEEEEKIKELEDFEARQGKLF